MEMGGESFKELQSGAPFLFCALETPRSVNSIPSVFKMLLPFGINSSMISKSFKVHKEMEVLPRHVLPSTANLNPGLHSHLKLPGVFKHF